VILEAKEKGIVSVGPELLAKKYGDTNANLITKF
jgi:hypothetical protein